MAQNSVPFDVEEATISQVHDAMKAGRLTCRGLVDQYLKRIEAYDKNGPAVNAIVMMSSGAFVARAQEVKLDKPQVKVEIPPSLAPKLKKLHLE